MMSRYVIQLSFIVILSCNTQTKSMESDEINNAKWYYYSYAMELKAYDKKNVEIQPLACNIRLLKLFKLSKDTSQIFFTVFNKDTLNTCFFRPIDLIGITVIRDKLYLPIYHSIVFDNESDSLILDRMKKQSLLLENKVAGNKNMVNSWLQEEVEKRQ